VEQHLLRSWETKRDTIMFGESFVAALGGPVIVGGEPTPFQSALKNYKTAVLALANEAKEKPQYHYTAVPMP